MTVNAMTIELMMYNCYLMKMTLKTMLGGGSQLKSKHAINLFKALGENPIIISFDNLHYKLKKLY